MTGRHDRLQQCSVAATRSQSSRAPRHRLVSHDADPRVIRGLLGDAQGTAIDQRANATRAIASPSNASEQAEVEAPRSAAPDPAKGAGEGTGRDEIEGADACSPIPALRKASNQDEARGVKPATQLSHSIRRLR